MLDPIRHQLENARVTRQRLKLIFDAAIDDGHRTDNPADYDTKLRPTLGKAPSAARHATITGQSRTMTCRRYVIAKFTALPDLNAQRARSHRAHGSAHAEIRPMKWSQLDLDAMLWLLKFFMSWCQ